MKNITITVSGTTGSGKTTIAYLIADFLSHTGFTTNINMLDELDLEQFEETFPDRLNALLKHELKIEVNEQQLCRSGIASQDVIYNIDAGTSCNVTNIETKLLNLNVDK